MEEDFFATIKMISGEEVLSRVCTCEEEDRTILILDNPVIIEEVTIRQIGMTALKIIPWMKFTDDTMFIVNLDKVITMSEIDNKKIIKLYNKYLRERDRITNKSELNSTMGYVSSISDARISLEKLYKSNI